MPEVDPTWRDPLEQRRCRGLLGPRRRREPPDGPCGDPGRLLCAGPAGQCHGEDRQPDGLVQLRVPIGELLLDPTDDRALSGPSPGCRPAEFVQRQRVALGSEHEVASSLSPRRSRHGVEQFVGSRIIERGEVQTSETGVLRSCGVPRGHDHDDRVLTDTTGQHPECPLGGRVDPVQVLGDDQERMSGGSVGEQRQGCESREQRRGLVARRAPEHHLQRLPLRCREVRDAVAERVQEQVERGVRLGGLGQGAGGREDPETAAARVLDDRGDERRLPDARFTVHHERGSAAGDVADGIPEDGRLPLTPDDGLRHRHVVSMPAALPARRCAVGISRPGAGSRLRGPSARR